MKERPLPGPPPPPRRPEPGDDALSQYLRDDDSVMPFRSQKGKSATARARSSAAESSRTQKLRRSRDKDLVDELVTRKVKEALDRSGTMSVTDLRTRTNIGHARLATILAGLVEEGSCRIQGEPGEEIVVRLR